jgi:hypothetical protein
MSSDKKIESITIPFNKVPNGSLQSELRNAMEVQFRHKFYNDIQFPYLHSLGIKHVLQGFGNEETGFVGILHLWWVNENSGIVYDNPRKSLVEIKGIWKSEWLDHPHEAIKLAQRIEEEKPYHENMLIEVHRRRIEEVAKKQAQKEISKRILEELEEEQEQIPDNILWN